MDFYDKWPELAEYKDLVPFEEADVTDHFASYNNIRTITGCKDWCVSVLTPDEHSCNPYGKIHGGLLETLADTTCGYLMYVNGIAGVTMSAEMHFLRDPKFGPIYCKASPKKLGRQVGVLDVELKDEANRIVMAGTVTFFAVGTDKMVEGDNRKMKA